MQNKPNILFILKTFNMGGVEVVSSALANKFVTEGHKVSIYTFSPSKESIEDRLDSHIYTCVMKEQKCNSINVNSMRNLMIEQQVEVVINQWGLPFYLLKTARKAAKGLNIKFISVYHNTPDMNGRIQGIQQEIDICKSPLKKQILKAKQKLFKAITAQGMRYNYKHSDKYMVLSPSFVEKFKQFTGIKNPSKLVVQTNPLTISSKGFVYDSEKKIKEVLYVGRLDYVQKRTERLLQAWALIEKLDSDWQLTIVGVGPDADNMKEQAKTLELQRIKFEGYQHPIPYYERASILALTSEFEGFPLVLAECMSFGVVPVVYNSYAAAGDIIDSGKNGLLVEKKNNTFSVEIFSNTLLFLMANSKKRNLMAQEAIKTAMEEYSLDNIYKQWTKVFQNL